MTAESKDASSLFDDEEFCTEQGRQLSCEVLAAHEAIFEKWAAMNYPLCEIANIVASSIPLTSTKFLAHRKIARMRAKEGK